MTSTYYYLLLIPYNMLPIQHCLYFKSKSTFMYVLQNSDLIDYNPRSQGHVPINQL